MKRLYGGIEGGGTKFVCAIGTGPDDIRAEACFPTTTPDETLAKAIQFFESHGQLSALGIGCFGPLDPNPASPGYGHILPTPKPGWTNADVVGVLRSAIGVPIRFDTDVNDAALGEWRGARPRDCRPSSTLRSEQELAAALTSKGNCYTG